jgi:hypothetical protein
MVATTSPITPIHFALLASEPYTPLIRDFLASAVPITTPTSLSTLSPTSPLTPTPTPVARASASPTTRESPRLANPTVLRLLNRVS